MSGDTDVTLPLEVKSTGPTFNGRMPRKTFLSGSLFCLLGVVFGRIPVSSAAAGGSGDLRSFVRLSEIASGTLNLPQQLAPTYLAALEAEGVLKMKPSVFARLAGVSAGGGPATVAALKRTAAYRQRGGKECLEAVAATWWSGIVPTAGGGQRVVTFADALVFQQVHESAECTGLPGSWAEPA